jgi:hypothetical protein
MNSTQAPEQIPFFGLYKAVTNHIGLCVVCQTEGKGVQTVTVQYRPFCRAEDQETGPMGTEGAWPVRPAAPAARKAIKARHIVRRDKI